MLQILLLARIIMFLIKTRAVATAFYLQMPRNKKRHIAKTA